MTFAVPVGVRCDCWLLCAAFTNSGRITRYPEVVAPLIAVIEHPRSLRRGRYVALGEARNRTMLATS
jgi:hypothetical protein